MKADSLSIFNYLDYRKFLLDYFLNKKKGQDSFSYRLLAQRANINAGTLVRVVKGSRNISLEICLRLAQALKLTKRETDYFQLLVLYNQANGHTEKNTHFEKILSFKNPCLKLLDPELFDFFSNWYNVAIKELLSIIKYKGDFQSVAKTIVPSITPEEAKQSLLTMERFGIIKKQKDGSYELVNKLISTPDSWKSLAINNFQIAMSKLAIDAFDRFPREQRDVSTMTFSVSDDGLNKIKERIKLFQQDIVQIVKDDSSVNRVYEMNVQLFPMSKKIKRCTGDE
jgi:uncharacterized protein (TIGR02147 family)